MKPSLSPIDLFGETNLNITASVALCYYPIHGNSIKQMLNSLKLAIYTVKKKWWECD